MNNQVANPEIKEVRFWHTITSKEKALFYEHLANMVDG